MVGWLVGTAVSFCIGLVQYGLEYWGRTLISSVIIMGITSFLLFFVLFKLPPGDSDER